ncbi:hypothetical protein BDV93DRAFT_526500 [Ceratobasidium sp. AG-I]|nr:hypothetical protein BDV93DRAFT_526500 [Ceratobasidium sp. AG-I]
MSLLLLEWRVVSNLMSYFSTGTQEHFFDALFSTKKYVWFSTETALPVDSVALRRTETDQDPTA